MKTSRLVLIACLLPVTASAAKHVLDLKREQQQGDSLCWAAVSTMAVRSLPRDLLDPQITQQRTVVYALAEVHTRTERLFTRRENFKNAEARCKDIRDCDQIFEPWLYRIDSTRLAPGMVLPESAIAHEIVVRKRPVIIQWDYSGVVPAPGEVLPTTRHALIITGYDDENHEVRIFDPWPPTRLGDPDPAKRERWLPYAAYVDPQSVLGRPIRALHEFDLYMLRRVGRAEPGGVPAPIPLADALREPPRPDAMTYAHTDDLPLTHGHVTH
ncbi:MAG TPA: hypothetical protein VFS13_12510 [Steroidobacteraceae bacterium]|jgi:hypothetical protein|nr:hypothetical protein [Steroidobacteraceae bacterium]